MITAKSRLIRAMKQSSRVRFGDGADLPDPWFAVYENFSEKIYVSELGLNFNGVDILYENIVKATCLVGDEVLLDGVMVSLKGGGGIKIPISGHDANWYDAHAFVRFLMRTVEDRSGGR